ncbi:hypothetical protein BKA56DRAFT_574578 [Ilyonectria sp. MPI-CAGE-AT-0026]|nr:hypothetical protein BKA56DRAFT_574578 [Ilyonectria sp. MPI-CAGE-AT-0026]
MLATTMDPPESYTSDLKQPNTEVSSRDNDTTATFTTSLQTPEKLLGVDGDILIPKPEDIDRVFLEGRETWAQLVALAESLPRNSLPAGLDDPSIMLNDVPALPPLPEADLLTGRPVWHIPSAEHGQDDKTHNKGWDLEQVSGTQKHFTLSFSAPIECYASPQVNSATPRGLLLLTLCWSYILSVRLWELQGKTATYTMQALQPRTTKVSHTRQDEINLDMRAPASRDLVRWLSAILASKPGWSVEGGGFAPWAAFCSGDAQFAISTDEVVTFAPKDRPPSSDKATELLIELCSLYGFEPSRRKGGRFDSLSPVTAAFLAALALPFYRSVGLQPHFSTSTLRRRSIDQAELEPIRQYVADLRYYMTLSMHPMSVGSIIWSVFWQPAVQCNVVSPWLSSILSVVRPIIDAGNLDMLAKTFAFRRPRVALWWQGIFLLGNPAIPGFIVRYLETLEERWGYGSMAPPDTTVSAWTGSPQSFLDEESSSIYSDLKDLVPRADLLRLRYNFRLQDTTSVLLSWRPFGVVPKQEIELELWPSLEHHASRSYLHWVWWMKKGENVVGHDIQRGFRKDTGRFVPDVADHLDTTSLDHVTKCSWDVNLEPSREATLRMVSFCMEDVIGDRDDEISAVPGIKTHPWLEDWRGLE